MEFNYLGVAFIDEDLPTEIALAVEQKMEELRNVAIEEFDKFLAQNDLEQAMGVIIKKETVIAGR